MKNSILLENKIKARKLIMKAPRFTMIREMLYIKSFFGPLLRWISKEDVKKVLMIIHSGVCRNHSGRRSLAHKAIKAGYYWPYMMQGAKDYDKKYEKC